MASILTFFGGSFEGIVLDSTDGFLLDGGGIPRAMIRSLSTSDLRRWRLTALDEYLLGVIFDYHAVQSNGYACQKSSRKFDLCPVVCEPDKESEHAEFV